ncbi:MAG: hypothetical protein CMH49_03505 [Myxococcales bacterium]|nr:hypothetical protein [Myxococcales bacterium]
MSRSHDRMKTHLIITHLRYTLVLALLCSGHTAFAEDRHFVPRYQIALGLGLANTISPEKRRQLPWREMNTSALIPSRADLGISYHHPNSRWFGEFAMRLFRIGFESKETRIRSFSDPKGQGLALGELSLRYIPKSHRAPRLLVGHFILNLNHSHWSHLAEQSLSPLEYNGWLQEDPNYSLSMSPLDRFVIGTSLMGHIASSEYRISVATPSSNTGHSTDEQQETGLLFDLALGIKRKSARIYLNFLYAHQLQLQASTLNFIDQQLVIQYLNEQRDKLQGFELYRNSLWLNLNFGFKIWSLGDYQAQLSSTLGMRSSKLQGRTLSKAEEASLSESQLIGVGLSSRYCIEFLRKTTKKSQQRWPDHLRMSYLWRDPHTQFAFDERHRSLLELIYQGQSSSLIFWWQHLWSSNRNRWSLTNDFFGISLEFSSPKRPPIH